jgi:hypothetical protein
MRDALISLPAGLASSLRNEPPFNSKFWLSDINSEFS